MRYISRRSNNGYEAQNSAHPLCHQMIKQYGFIKCNDKQLSLQEACRQSKTKRRKAKVVNDCV